MARELQMFVRKMWQRLQHRFDMATFARQFRLPLGDVQYWLQEHPDEWAFLPYEDSGPVLERGPLNADQRAPSTVAKTRVFRHHFVNEVLGEALKEHPAFDPRLYIRD